MDEIKAELAAINTRLAAIETSDRLQSEHLTRIRRVQLACVAGLIMGGLLQQGLISQGNRELLERVAIGAIAASLTGAIGVEFVGGKK